MPYLQGGLSPFVRSLIRYVLFSEIIINVCNGLVSMFYPSASLQGMTNINLSSGTKDIQIALEVCRWFGVLGLVFGGYVLARVVNNKLQLKPVIEGLLIGDILYLGSFLPFTLEFGKLPLILAPFLLTLIMFLARITLLLFEDWTSEGTNVSDIIHKSSGAVLLVDESITPPATSSQLKKNLRRKSLTSALSSSSS